MKAYGQLECAQLENLSTAPSVTPTGRIFWDTALGLARVYNGTTWIALTASTASLIPSADATYDIGSSAFKWQDLYLSRNAAIGGTLAVTGAATLSSTLAVTGVVTLTAKPILSSLTVSLPVFSDGSKGLVSNAMTGTGSVVMSSSPTLTFPTIDFIQTVNNFLAIMDNGDNTKQIAFSMNGNTTGKRLTLISAVTNLRSLTFPDATDTLAGISATQTLTNKTIDAASNTITNLNNATISATAGIQLSKLEALTSSQIIVGSVANVPTAVSMTGDITISNTGVTSIGALRVTSGMLAGSIAYSKLNLTGAILNADLAGSIAYSKLSLTGAILNADLAGSIADTKLSTIATAGKVSDSALPSSMATKTFTGVTTFPASSSIDGSGNAVWGGSAQVGNNLSTGLNAFNGKTTNRTGTATNGGSAITVTVSTAGYPGLIVIYGANSGNSALISFGASATLVITAIVGTEFVPARTSGVQTVVTYNNGTGVLSLQNFSGSDQTYGLAKLGF